MLDLSETTVLQSCRTLHILAAISVNLSKSRPTLWPTVKSPFSASPCGVTFNGEPSSLVEAVGLSRPIHVLLG